MKCAAPTTTGLADKMSPDRIASAKAGYILLAWIIYLQVDSYYPDVKPD
jgi:hypothetical protein